MFDLFRYAFPYVRGTVCYSILLQSPFEEDRGWLCLDRHRYFRAEMTARNVYVINKLRWDRHDSMTVASALRDHNLNGGRKYEFPENVCFKCAPRAAFVLDFGVIYVPYAAFAPFACSTPKRRNIPT